jgi:energy-coupling factor transporter ATP-binding protein EcfA2
VKVTSITCENFRCWRELNLDLPETISVFVGKNGAGKSSILDALRACLTGTARGVARGDAADLATWGTTSWAVELGLLVGEAPGRIRRTSTTLSAVRPTGEKVKITQEQLAARIGDAQTLDAILDTGRALEMSAGDRKALVYRLAKISVDDSALAAAGLSLVLALEIVVLPAAVRMAGGGPEDATLFLSALGLGAILGGALLSMLGARIERTRMGLLFALGLAGLAASTATVAQPIE